MSKEHLLAYYRWNDRTHWKLDSMDRNPRGKPVLAYVHYKDNLWQKYAMPPNILWVIGLGPDETPTLEARIPVERRRPQRDEGGRLGQRVESAPGGGTFFGLNCAAPEIMQLVFANQRKKYWSLRERQGSKKWVRRHGLHLRTSRRIAAMGEETTEGYVSHGVRPLEQLEKRSLEKSIFISWKHQDNENRRLFLRDLTVALTKREYSVWLDQLALGGAERLAQRANNRSLMRRLLHQGLECSRVVLAVWTKNYGQPSQKRRARGKRDNWTRSEWEDTKDVKRLALIPAGLPTPTARLAEPHDCVVIPESPGPGDVEATANDIVTKCTALLAASGPPPGTSPV